MEEEEEEEREQQPLARVAHSLLGPAFFNPNLQG